MRSLRSLPSREAGFIEPMECLAVAKLPDGPRVCGVRRYVALATRSGYGCTRAVAQRHIIPIKGFAGTASVQRHPSSVLEEWPADLAGCERFGLP
jgi:hypothetical protein